LATLALAASAFTKDDPRIIAPLASFAGRFPEAPSWFARAIAQSPERRFLTIAGARVETLSWGERGRQGLLFLHGNSAHADWYSFIAPFFAARHNVASLSWSGMGASDWREDYSYDGFVQEAYESLQALGMLDGAPKPVVIGHSFGGQIALRLSAHHGDDLAAAILVDPPVFAPHKLRERAPRLEGKSHRIYPDLPSALARFRLAPLQPCDNLFIIDHIARLSLRKVPQDETGAPGWSWRFDPDLWGKLRYRDLSPVVRDAKCPLALVRGGISRLMRPDDAEHMRSLMPADAPYIEVPEANHHVMLDQPLAFVAAVEALIESWPPAARR
jgi:pimeloyl-ACP methyl ester carboxylesterase